MRHESIFGYLQGIIIAIIIATAVIKLLHIWLFSAFLAEALQTVDCLKIEEISILVHGVYVLLTAVHSQKLG